MRCNFGARKKISPRANYNAMLEDYLGEGEGQGQGEGEVEQGSRSSESASLYQCGPGSILGLGVVSGLSLLVLYSALFSPLSGNQHLI